MKKSDKIWERTYRNNINTMTGICYRYVFDIKQAEDLAQDAFLSAIEKYHTYSGRGKFEAWLYRITVNKCLLYLRDQKSGLKLEEWMTDEKFYMEENNDIYRYNFSQEQILDAINNLPEHHRLVFNLYVLDGFSHKQISNELGISIGTSKSHLSRARKKLQRILLKNSDITEVKSRGKGLSILFIPFGVKRFDSNMKTKFKRFTIGSNQSTHLNPGIKSSAFKPGKIQFIYTLKTVLLPIFALLSFSTIVLFFKEDNPEDKELILTTPVMADTIDTTKIDTLNRRGSKEIEDSIIIRPVIVKKVLFTHKTVVVRDTIKVKKKH